MSGKIEQTRLALHEATVKRLQARRAYLDALEADDAVTRVAFLLYRHSVLREPDWPVNEPVTWEQWHTLQIEEERDEWRELALQIMNEINSAS